MQTTKYTKYTKEVSHGSGMARIIAAVIGLNLEG
jgi:hypothetical protein